MAAYIVTVECLLDVLVEADSFDDVDVVTNNYDCATLDEKPKQIVEIYNVTVAEK
ncbi:hypothetical protein [Gallibacterium salpingitidis]|uniref:hypothetical protein n=1 Tax=Gallibacterium salpingitidis TaxID=505341 RepID=UPI0018D4262B|nr:hypothetical protein [Gallibacterium salpingitidis]